MNTQTTPTSDPKPQRDAKGGFLPGNDGGAGNLFHRHLARARVMWNSCVLPEHVEKVYNALLEKACDGCVSAQKLYLQYVLGKPTQMVNPDHVDIDEWEFYAKTNEMQKKSPDVMTSPDHRFALEIARTMRPEMAEQARKEMLVGLKEMEENDREMERVEDEYEQREKEREAAAAGVGKGIGRETPGKRGAHAKREAARRTQMWEQALGRGTAPSMDGFFPDRPPSNNGFLPGHAVADFAVANQLPPIEDGFFDQPKPEND